MSDPTTPLKMRLRTDLTAAMKDRDKVRSSTIRMVLSAISEAEVAGAQAVQLSEQQVLDVVVREAKKRREAEEAFATAGRTELAEKEHAEGLVLADYLPEQLSAEEMSALVAETISTTGAQALGLKGMGKVMGVLTPKTKGKVDGSALAAEVRRQLSAELARAGRSRRPVRGRRSAPTRTASAYFLLLVLLLLFLGLLLGLLLGLCFGLLLGVGRGLPLGGYRRRVATVGVGGVDRAELSDARTRRGATSR